MTTTSLTESTIAPSGSVPEGSRLSRHRGPVLAVLCVSLLIVSLDSTILNVALPTIANSMHASSTELQWIVDAYSIAFAGLLLVAGSLGDRLGRKWVFMVGLVLFVAGSAAAAFSDTPDRLIAARAFMGVGAAAIMPCTLSILTNVFTLERERALVGNDRGRPRDRADGGRLAACALLVGVCVPRERPHRPSRAARDGVAHPELEEPFEQ